MFSDYPRLLGRFRTTHRRFYRSKCPLISYQLSVISYQFTVYCLLITEKLPTFSLPHFQFIIHNLCLLRAFK
ncbi:MAG: hypothetical protein EWV67_15055 [Microcystis sp. M_QC_C_20170808_M2Col]|nr:MAG: hypothetical protein EWV67_15055 [Microcystis sp. M_QC_C_20170808_M2Col]TRT71933.1 MAG: hypothetical protein EWV68_03480 [Microcystis sp. M_QC_C_20170808_M9Col]